MNSLPEPKPIRLRKLFGKTAYVVLMLLTSLSFLALFVPPQTLVFFQWLGVCLPFLLFFNVIFLIIAFYKRSWYSICPLVAILANFHYFPQKIQFNTPVEAPSVDIKFATFNVQEFKMIYNLSSMEQIADYLAQNGVNTVCLQEVPGDHSVAALQRVFTTMPHVVITGGKSGQLQLAILSKYPLDSVRTVSFEERVNCALFADILVKNQKIRLGNYHLQTTNWNQVKGALIPQQESKGNWLDALGTISQNFRYRGRQVDSLRSIMDRSPYPMIMSGDFNNTPFSYSYSTIKGDLKDAFREAGNGYGYTYRYFMKLFRIDFVFFNGDKFQALKYRTGDVDFSDHLPVLVDLNIK